MSQTITSGFFRFPSLRRWYRYSVLRLLVLESSSVLRRMGWLLEIRAVERGRGKDSTRQLMEECLVPEAHKSAYIPHMQHTEGRFPFLSIFDLWLLSRSWRAGLEYGIHIGTLQTDKTHSSANPDSGNSMPRLTVQQSSKRDPSDLPPSQA